MRRWSEIFQDEWGFELEPFDEWWQRHVAMITACGSLFGTGTAKSRGLGARAGRRRGGGLVGTGSESASMAASRPRERALLLHLLCELRRRGAARAGLGVDAENPTGATRLYESAGMYVEGEHVTFVKELERSSSARRTLDGPPKLTEFFGRLARRRRPR